MKVSQDYAKLKELNFSRIFLTAQSRVLIAIRTRNNFTQKQMSEFLYHANQSTYSKYERGKLFMPAAEMMSVLDQSTEHIFYEMVAEIRKIREGIMEEYNQKEMFKKLNVK